MQGCYTVFESPAANEPDEYEVDIEGFTPVVVAEKTKELMALSVSDAVLEMDMSGAPVLPFKNSADGNTSVVYRRADGHIGWINLASQRSIFYF